jgi:hypothetical protein
MSKRAGQENNLQLMVYGAIRWYFCLHSKLAKRPVIDGPSSGQQGTDLNKRGGKPYDLGVFYDDARVLLLELKDRRDNNEFDGMEEGDRQHLALKALWQRGVHIWYAYNSWDWDYLDRDEADLLLDVHALTPLDFKNPLPTPLDPPAATLKGLLESLCDQGAAGVRLNDVLAREPAFIEQMSVHTLVVLVNVDQGLYEILESPKQLMSAKIYYQTDPLDRPKVLAALEKKDDVFGVWLANFMFELADGPGLDIGPEEDDPEPKGSRLRM